MFQVRTNHSEVLKQETVILRNITIQNHLLHLSQRQDFLVYQTQTIQVCQRTTERCSLGFIVYQTHSIRLNVEQ